MAKTFPLPSVIDIVAVVISSVIGVLGLSAAVEGYFKQPMALWQRIVLGAGSLMLIIPELITDLVGIAIVAAMILLNYRQK